MCVCVCVCVCVCARASFLLCPVFDFLFLVSSYNESIETVQREYKEPVNEMQSNRDIDFRLDFTSLRLLCNHKLYIALI